jgi:hypothetical protein
MSCAAGNRGKHWRFFSVAPLKKLHHFRCIMGISSFRRQLKGDKLKLIYRSTWMITFLSSVAMLELCPKKLRTNAMLARAFKNQPLSAIPCVVGGGLAGRKALPRSGRSTLVSPRCLGRPGMVGGVGAWPKKGGGPRVSLVWWWKPAWDLSFLIWRECWVPKDSTSKYNSAPIAWS